MYVLIISSYIVYYFCFFRKIKIVIFFSISTNLLYILFTLLSNEVNNLLKQNSYKKKKSLYDSKIKYLHQSPFL